LSGTQTELRAPQRRLPTDSESPPVVGEEWTAPPTARRGLGRIRWQRVAVVGFVAAIAIGAYTGFQRLRPGGPGADVQLFQVVRRSFPIVLLEKGELKAAESTEIRCELEGRSTIIRLIDEGAHVRKGDLLVELASDEIDEKIRDAEIKEASAKAAFQAAEKELQILIDENASKIRKAELAFTLARDALEKYKEGEAVELRQDAALAMEKARYVLQRAEEQLKDSQKLYEQGYVTRIDLENDRFAEYQAKLELTKAELALKVLEKYTIPMALKEKESAVTEARKELERTKNQAQASEAKATAEVLAKKSEFTITQDKLARLRDQKAKARIVAPTEGLVVYARSSDWHRTETRIEEGAQVYERQSLIELPDTTRMKVVIRVHEAKTEKLKIGLPATVEIEGFTGQKFTGRVSKIAVLADSRSRWLNPNLKEYETEILLDGTFSQLKPGITARAEILVTELRNVLAVPVQAVFGKGSKYFVFVDEGGRTRPVEVRIGLSSTEYVEIKDGLSEGQMVRLAVTDEMKLMLPEDTEDAKEQPPAPTPARRARAKRSLDSRPASAPA